MPTDYYPEPGPSASEPEPNADVGMSSALLPKSISGRELKPGDTITLKVVKTYEDEIEVECQKSKGEPEKQQETPGAPMTADQEIDEMASEPEE